jgi:probable rRNA maturation factor
MIRISMQNASAIKAVPKLNAFKKWINAAMQDRCDKAEIGIRLMDEEESTHLNETYRKKKGPTNVLSFVYNSPINNNINYPIGQVQDLPLRKAISLEGDLAICVPVMQREAEQQNISLEYHWAHIAVHGALHLLGYDHEKEDEAIVMEALEKNILETLGYQTP